jgi:hypothetical protein
MEHGKHELHMIMPGSDKLRTGMNLEPRHSLLRIEHHHRTYV